MDALAVRGEAQAELFARARRAREEAFSGCVEVRSVLEYANVCRQACHFCGIGDYSSIKRYALSHDEIVRGVESLYQDGRRAVMIQSGEWEADAYFGKLLGALKEVKERFPDLVLIGALGSLSDDG